MDAPKEGMNPFGWPWWGRYPLSILILAVTAYGLFVYDHQEKWVLMLLEGTYAFLAVIFALALAREAACFLVIVGILSVIGSILGGLPTGVAIIIGAMIIAAAVSGSRKPNS